MLPLERYRPLLIVLALQMGILIAIPARKLIARAAGTEVRLRTVPYDPYDILSGYYVTLSYEAERPTADQRDEGLENGDEVFVTIVRDTPVWRLESVTRDRPRSLSEDRVSIRARWNGRRAILDGAGRFFIPEDKRLEVEANMAKTRGQGIIDMMVDRSGTPALRSLEVNGTRYGAR